MRMRISMAYSFRPCNLSFEFTQLDDLSLKTSRVSITNDDTRAIIRINLAYHPQANLSIPPEDALCKYIVRVENNSNRLSKQPA
jgi:hypothetical protein